MDSYREFVQSKMDLRVPTGILDDVDLSYARPLFPFHELTVRWALRLGRCAALFATGLGKTAMQIAWADQVCRHTNGDVLILAPLAVAQQTVREAALMGVEIRYCRSGEDVRRGITITNYDMLKAFDLQRFVAAALDEASILKNLDGRFRNALVSRFRYTQFRSAWTATPAPNDQTELGNQAEFLGVMRMSEMLARYFYHDGGDTSKWHMKGHARTEFWRWVASWGAMVTRPSDLGFSDDGYTLPPLRYHEHVVSTDRRPAQGSFIAMPAKGLTEQRQETKATIRARCEAMAELVAAQPNEPWIIWTEVNPEGKLLRELIPGLVSIAGPDKPEAKEERLEAFASGQIRYLETKPKIAGFGLNWQHCARVGFVGPTNKWEQYYQAIRRCWRFGQTRPVDVHVVSTDGLSGVLENMRRKDAAAAAMADELRAIVSDYVRANVSGAKRDYDVYDPRDAARLPTWLRSRPGDPTPAVGAEYGWPDPERYTPVQGTVQAEVPSWLV